MPRDPGPRRCRCHRCHVSRPVSDPGHAALADAPHRVQRPRYQVPVRLAAPPHDLDLQVAADGPRPIDSVSEAEVIASDFQVKLM